MDPVIEEELRLTADALLDRMRRHVTSRRARVSLLACATRAALDVLPLEERAPGFVERTWELPPRSASEHGTLRDVATVLDRFITKRAVRAILLSRTTQMAIDDLSPDEQLSALTEATQIIGTPPRLTWK